jgi:hypothetical protein
MKTRFRKIPNTVGWHFHRDCPEWPANNFEEKATVPVILCQKCTDLKARELLADLIERGHDSATAAQRH